MIDYLSKNNNVYCVFYNICKDKIYYLNSTKVKREGIDIYY